MSMQLNVTKDFLDKFKVLSKEDQIERINRMTVEEVEVLEDAGYKFAIENHRVTDVFREDEPDINFSEHEMPMAG